MNKFVKMKFKSLSNLVPLSNLLAVIDLEIEYSNGRSKIRSSEEETCFNYYRIQLERGVRSTNRNTRHQRRAYCTHARTCVY